MARHSPFSITVEFTFPYQIDGATVAEFDARATATVTDTGAPPVFDPVHGGDPGWGPEWDNYRDIEVASSYRDSTKPLGRQLAYTWHQADDALAARIIAYLNEGKEDHAFAEAAVMQDAAE